MVWLVAQMQGRKRLGKFLGTRGRKRGGTIGVMLGTEETRRRWEETCSPRCKGGNEEDFGETSGKKREGIIWGRRGRAREEDMAL